MPDSPDRFTPAFGLGNPHLQTLWGPLWRPTTHLERQRERLWLDDGDFLDLDWHGPHSADAPLVLVLHGLTGSSNSPYVAGLQQALATRGWASAALNWRGCSGEPNLLPRSYHSGASEDLAAAIAHLRAKRPQAPLYAVGYSLGGNVLLKYLGESGSDSPLQGATAVSVPFRLDQCADRIGQGFSKVYQAHFMREMLAYIKDKQRQFQHDGRHEGLATLAQLGPLTKMRTFWDFDGRVTAPLHGFADAQDYYRRASSRYFLGQIRTPTLIIQAADDPFVFRHSLPEASELSASTQFELQAKGGHVGFVDGSLKHPGYYLERRIRSGWLAWIAMDKPARESIRFWQSAPLAGVELLAARYIEQRFVPHVHEGYVIGMIMAGAQRYRYRGAEHLAGSGTLVLINPDELHTGAKGVEDGWLYRAFYPENQQIFGLLDELELPSGSLPAFGATLYRDPDLVQGFARLHHLLESPATALQQQTQWREMLLLLLQRHAGVRAPGEPGQEHRAIVQAKELLRSQLAAPPSLEELAAAVNLSPFHFARVFRRATGIPPHTWLMQQRIAKARALLRDGCLPLEVATQLGFADQSHLSRQFKQVYGVAPAAYRSAVLQ